MMPETEINPEIKSIINKLDDKDKDIIEEYIENLLISNCEYWEETMGDDL